jgi:hypothetical protein
MATIARELYDGLVTVRDMLNTAAALLQRFDVEQQNCIHKLDVMAGIQLPAQPLPTPLSALASTNLMQSQLEMMDALPMVTEPPLLPTPTAATGTSVPLPLPCTPSPQPVVWLEPPPTEAVGTIEVGDGMAAGIIEADVAAFIHSDRQRLGDEQQPMSMDGLSALHPDLQQVDDKQQATSWAAAPQPAVQSELLLPPALPLSASTAAAAATYGPTPRPASLPAPPTVGTKTFGGIENLPPPSCAPKAAILCTVSIPASSPTLGLVAATSSYKPALFAWDPGVEGHTPTMPRPQRRVVVHIPQP